MTDLVERIGTVWLDAALGATFFFGMVAVAMVLCAQPARRCSLARSAMVVSLLILPLAWMAPGPRLRIPIPLTLQHLLVTRGLARIPVAMQTWLPLLTVGCLAGSLLTIAMLVLGWLSARRYIDRTIDPDPASLDLYLALPFSRRRRPALRVSARIRTPILVGIWRPTILIPPDLEEPGRREELRLGLLHELAHVERRDPWFGLAASLCRACWFFVPPLWWIRTQTRLDQELLADVIASDGFGPRVAYASSLVGMARAESEETSASEDSPSPLGGPWLLLRVLMLIRCPYPVEVRSPRWWSILTLLLVMAMGSVASHISLSATLGYEPDLSPPRLQRDGRHGVLQVSRIRIDPRVANSEGHTHPFTMLIRLPDRFEMVLDVWGTAEEIGQTAISGSLLGPLRDEDVNLPAGEGFHRVRMVRDSQGLRIWVANHPVVVSPKASGTQEWLSLLPPPGQPGLYRNLTLTW